MTGNPEFELTTGSGFEELELVDLLMGVVTGLAGLAEEEAATTGLAVREAAANAILHGNCQQKARRMSIRARIEPGRLVVEVRDEGEGFDPAQVPDPLAAANLLKPTGRGIFLMRGYMDEVVFTFPEEGGPVVTMSRSVPGPPAH